MASGGWNPRFGFDADQPPSAGDAMPSGGAYAAPPYPAATYGGMNGGYYMNSGQSSYPVPGPPNNGQGPAYVTPSNGYQNPVPVFPGTQPRYPTAHPLVNMDAPCLNLINSTGGHGCEPGYNYFFGPSHTKLHVIKSDTAPWQAERGMSMHFGAYHVPTNVTFAEILSGFGAVNPKRKLNKITEVVDGGDGKLYKGMTISGDEKDKLKMSLKEVGWDSSRTGRAGEKPAIWVWITKD
ncbi:hypothetical protein F4778DRAFT_668661 [Xylariomycetidae sp. FL2044]|nr:hypothetical protein F4778DRAFT_668661 [Xylariomycetidae sp. FL2044]